MGSLQLHGIWPTWLLVVISIGLALLAWWLYFRESRILSGPDCWLLPTLRSSAILLTLLLLLQPSCHHRWQEGTPAKLNILLDLSESMSVEEVAPNTNLAPSSSFVQPGKGIRLQRADQVLLAGQLPQLEQWAESHRVTVQTLFNDQLQTVWGSATNQTSQLPISVMDWQNRWGSSTSLGTALQKWNEVSDGDAKEQASIDDQSEDLFLIFSDGQNNFGPNSAEIASQLRKQGKRIFAVGMGPRREDHDLSLLNVATANSIYFTDLVTGKIEIQDRLETASSVSQNAKLNIKAMVTGDSGTSVSPILWQQDVTIDGSGKKDANFSFSIKQWIEEIKANWRDVEYSTLPITFVVEISNIEGERTFVNNQKRFQVSVATRRQRVLLVDGRSRWESRFLRNSLERDPNWQVDSFLWDSRGVRSFSQGRNEITFPQSLEEFLDYDLVVFGEVPLNLVPANVQSWIAQFVSATGGGLIIIDGKRKYWSETTENTLLRLLPVELNGSVEHSASPMQIQLTSVGEDLGVMQLAETPEQTREIWKQLPGMKSVVHVEVLPGGETLAYLTATDGTTHPYLVTRLFGAGRVLYFASDESWRWRYVVEDRHHQKFWNQVARWAMRSPFMVQSEWLALDTGKVFYSADQTVHLRARLMQPDGKPSELEFIEGIVASTSEGAEVVESDSRKVQMAPVADYPGVYEGQIILSQPDNYSFRVSVPGYQTDVLDLQAQFSIDGNPVDEYADLTCNESWLEQICSLTGGQYVHESETQRVANLISKSSDGKFVEEDTLLWQSYVWFTPIVILLSIEWWRRKQVGLI